MRERKAHGAEPECGAYFLLKKKKDKREAFGCPSGEEMNAGEAIRLLTELNKPGGMISFNRRCGDGGI